MTEGPVSGTGLALELGAQGGAAVATAGSSVAVQLGVQAAVLVGTTLLSRAFDRKAVLQKRRRIPDPASTEWNKNPIARHPTGEWVIDGGTVMAAFHKTNKDASKASTRCDVVIALAGYDLPDPTLLNPIVRTADADPNTVLDRFTEGFLMYVNGRDISLIKQRERDEDGNERNGQITSADKAITYQIRDHYEPYSDSGHAGSIRAYLNKASDPDDVRWQELRAYLRQEPTWWDRAKDGPYTQSDYYKGWGPQHQLRGITGIHLIMNYSPRGITGNRWNSNEKKQTQITSFPTVSFEYRTSRSGNPADVLEYLVEDVWGFDESIINAVLQAKARQRCEDYMATQGQLKLKPMRIAGVLTESEPPLRLMQMIETVSGGNISFRDNKIGLVAGEYKQNTPAERHLTEQDLWRAPSVTTNIANNQRRNAVQGTLEVCLQSKFNSPVELPLVRNNHQEVKDNNLFIERVPRIGYVNDYYDAQQLMAIHNELQGARRRVLLPIRDPDETRRDWGEGTDIVVNMPSIGIVGATFIIDETELEVGEGLVISAFEQPDEDPFEFLDEADFDIDPDDEILEDIQTAEILVPEVSNIRRPEKKANSNIDVIAFDVARIDKDYLYWFEMEYRTNASGDAFDLAAEDNLDPDDAAYTGSRRYYILPINQLTYQYQNLEFNDQDIFMRMRYRTSPSRDGSPVGAWTADSESAHAVDAPPTVLGLTVTAIQPTSAFAYWLPADYVGHKQVELRYGTGDVVGTDTIGDPVVVTGGRSTYGHTLTELTPETGYWVQVRFVNQADVAEDWADAASATFTTTAVAAATSFVLRPVALNLQEEEVVNATLPVATNIPSGVTLEYSVEGMFPMGLAFTAASRNVAGTVAEQTARIHAYLLTYKATDAADPTQVAVAPLYINVAQDDQPITFAQGDTEITAFFGETTLEPASPQLPQATGGEATLSYAVRELPNWLTFDATTRRVALAIDGDGDPMPVPATAHRNASFIYEATDGTTTARLPISIFVEHKSEIEEQCAFQWHNDYITGPAVANTQGEQADDDATPADWTRDSNTPRNAPPGKPFLWKIFRRRVLPGPWTVWGNPEQDVATVVNQPPEEQCAWQWSNDYITAPAVANTQGEQTDDDATPTNWLRARGSAPTGKPFLWRICRERNGSGPWTLWGNPEQDVATVVNQPPEEQCAWQWSNDYITAPAVANTQGEQTDDDATPTNWLRARGSAPTGKPFLWRICRERNGSGPWTLWGNPEQDVATVVNQPPEEQCAWQWSNDYITAPAVANTQGEQTDDDATPTNWLRARGSAPTGKPFLWRICRERNGSGPWTLWGNPEQDVATVVNQPPEEQCAWQWSNDYITAPAVANTQGEQTDDDATPTNWLRARGSAPTGKPFLWRICRERNGSGPWTLWGNPEQDVATVVHGTPIKPTGVTNSTPVNGSMAISWTSVGPFFTEVYYEYLESAAWHFGGREVSYGQSCRLFDLTRSTSYRYSVRHRFAIDGTPGPWFDFT